MHTHPSRRVRFGAFELDLSTGELRSMEAPDPTNKVLQRGRAQRLMGDNAAARKSYEEFLQIWKDADPDLPVYRQAKTEYAQLKNLSN
jgi:hypothetical protein